MSKITVTESEAMKPVPEGLYQAAIVEVKEDSGEFGPYVKVTFEIVKGEYKGIIKMMVASLKMSKSKTGKNSKLYDLVKAATKVEPDTGEEFDTDSLIGKVCQILVKNGKEMEGVLYQDIKDVMPL
ncbi:hypothetical protein BH09PAT1_BH09PAT1_3990 [soil metagenome]